MSLFFARFFPRRTAALLVGFWLGGVAPGGAADPAVSNVKAVQRAGTKWVEVVYDLAAEAAVAVGLEISEDGGATFAVSAASATGAVGPGVSPGLGKALAWNAEADWDGQYSAQVRFRVSAGHGVAPAGFAVVPGGAFARGDALGEGDGDELPVRSVEVGAFYIGKREVTKEEWDGVRAWAMGHGYPDLGAGAGGAADHPVQMVSWWDAVKWCNARSEQEGLAPCYALGGVPLRAGTEEPSVNWAAQGYRLPTEAEWEKAARGGLSGKRFSWGDTISHSQANYWSDSFYAYDLSPTPEYHPAFVGTSPAGSFAANGYGLQDMAGNVWEWCWDWYAEQAYGTGGARDPRGAPSGVFRVYRGGGWQSDANNCRAAFRMIGDGVDQYGDAGFRAVRKAAPTASATSSPTSVDARNPPLAWTLFAAAEAALPGVETGLLSLKPLDRLSTSPPAASRDGTAALRFTAVDGGVTSAERRLEGPAEVSFWWRVSSEEDRDFFACSVDGAPVESCSGDGTWMNRSFIVGVGRHAVRWSYRKDERGAGFEDAAYLDSLVVKPLETYANLEVRRNGVVLSGKESLDYGKVWQGAEEVMEAFSLKNTGTAVLPITISLTEGSGFVFNYGRTLSTQSLGAGEERTLLLTLQTGSAGKKTALLEMAAAGSRTAPPALALSGFVEAPILQVAGAGLVVGSVVNTGSTAAWEAAATSLPGGGSGAALKAGRTLDGGNSTLGARFAGPGLLRWQWKVSSQPEGDWLLCEVNGEEVAGIAGTAEQWQSQVIQVPAGAEVRWSYRKDGANQAGIDSGYLVDVRFDAFAAVPISFGDWSAANGGIGTAALTGPGKIQGVFAWLGGFDPVAGPGEGYYQPLVSDGFYRFRYAISKSAGGQVQPQVSRDLATWNSRGLSQTVVSESEAAATVELAIPAAGKIYTRLKASLPRDHAW